MAAPRKDALLGGAQVLTGLFQIVSAIIVGAMPVLIVVLYLKQDWMLDRLGDKAPHIATVNASLTLLFVGFALIGLASLFFFGRLRQIIGTVEQGDPFQAENSHRLAQMGWIALATQLVAAPLAGVAGYLQTQFPTEKINIDVGFSLSSLLLALVLFILARVFRHGAAMRADLEGTV